MAKLPGIVPSLRLDSPLPTLAQTPIHLTQHVRHWPCMSKWSIDYLKSHVGETQVQANTSKDGKFNITSSRHEDDNGSVSLKLNKLFDVISTPSPKQIYFLQQLSLKNLPLELTHDIGPTDFLNQTLHRETNLWISHAKSQIPLHYDRSDNFLVQVSGTKTIRLWHPSRTGGLSPGYQGVSFASPIDPDNVDIERFPAYSQPDYQLHLQAGQALYLPAYWWHHVTTTSQYAISVNYWYDTAAQQPNHLLRRYLEENTSTKLEQLAPYHQTLAQIFSPRIHSNLTTKGVCNGR